MNIQILAVGKIKEKYLQAGIKEYLKRLSKYGKIKIIEVPDEKTPNELTEKEEKIIKDTEGKRILEKIKEGSFVIALDLKGEMFTSEAFAKKIETLGIQGKSNIAFIIGGSLGLSEEVLKRSDLKISFGKMTFPHQLMRLILLEQIYRSFRIIKGEPYHK